MGILQTSYFGPTVLPAVAGVVLTAAAPTPASKSENTISPLTPSLFGGSSASIEGSGCISAITPRSSTSTAGEFLAAGPLIVGGSISAGYLEATIEAAKVPYVGGGVKKEIDPKLRDFVKRIFVPALVKRYISGLKQKRLLVAAVGNAS
jgi:hypothetical protein